MSYRIVVINPNSTQQITDDFSAVLDVHRSADMTVECLTLKEGPAGIVTQMDKARVSLPLCDLMARRTDADAFVIACFGDPGLAAAREATPRPVYGIAESSFYIAMSLGDRFGILSTDIRASWRHERYARELGIAARLSADLSIEIPILELNHDKALTLRRLSEAGATLKGQGAQSIILGCAGLVPFAPALEQACGLRVIDPIAATVGLACANLRTFGSGAA